MRNLEGLVKILLLWRVLEIIKIRAETLSNETTFQLEKYPAVKNSSNGDVIKNISQICYNTNGTNDEILNIHNDTAQILNIFKNILQEIQNSECREIEKKHAQREPDLDRHHFDGQQREEEKNQSPYDVQEPFSILQQLSLDEQKQKWQQHKQEQQLLQEQQNALKLQHIIQHFEGENFGKASKKKRRKKKKRKKRKKRKKKKPIKDKKKKPIKQDTSLFAQPAHVLFASQTQKPLHNYHEHDDGEVTTQHPLTTFKKIKYILRKNTILSKKKKEYLNHLKHVIYPFVKFITFFTVINPFTLAVFLFSLISPMLLSFLGFMGLSFFVKPALHLIFGVENTLSAIKRRKLLELRKRRRLQNRQRPITIHKHYYKQTPIVPTAPQPHYSLRPKGPRPYYFPSRNRHQHAPASQIKFFNPLLPVVRQKLKKYKQQIPFHTRYQRIQ